MKLDLTETSYLYWLILVGFICICWYVPYLSIYEFYRHIKKYRHHYKNTNINSKIIGTRKRRAIKAMSLPGVIGLMGYLYYVAYGENFYVFTCNLFRIIIMHVALLTEKLLIS